MYSLYKVQIIINNSNITNSYYSSVFKIALVSQITSMDIV